MFRNYISEPIDPIPVEYTRTLAKLSQEPDYSLMCLGIALLKPRIENYKGISGIYCKFDKKSKAVEDFQSRFSSMDSCPLFCYYYYDENDADDDFIESHLPEHKEKKSIAKFMKDNVDCECIALYHETKNAAAVFINSHDIRLYHLLLTFIPLYFPSLFKDNPAQPAEYELVKTLSKKDHGPFVKAIQNIVTPYIAEFRKLQLGNLIERMHKSKVSAAYTNVQNARRNMENAEESYARCITQLKELMSVYEGLVAVENTSEAENELIEYLSTNKFIRNIKINDNVLSFSVACLLTNYNEHVWEIFSNKGGIYDGKYSTDLPEVFLNKNNRKILLDSIFSDDPKLMVKMVGNYNLDMRNNRMSTNSGYDYVKADPMYKSYIPNPHIKLFACLGGYKEKVMHELMEGNYITAIEMCIASAGSVNLEETEQTFRPFIGWILKSKEKILRRKDGVDMTPEEALIWLIDKENKDEAD